MDQNLDESVGDSTQSVNDSTSQLPTDWFDTNINSYYKNNLKIGHLNVNSIYGKADEVIEILNICKFDILFIAESKLDESVGNSLFSHLQYRIIRRDRKKGAGGLFVYVRSTIVMRRQRSLEPAGIESVTIDVKEFGNNWFIICACYPSPGKCKSADFISACVCTAEKMYNKQKEIMFIGDFNMNMLEGKDI